MVVNHFLRPINPELAIVGSWTFDYSHPSTSRPGQTKICYHLRSRLFLSVQKSSIQGELKEGELLPSIRALANDLHVSVLTTRRVYNELESEGFVISKAGKGSFVATENLELLRESKRHRVEVKLTEAWKTARSLGISKNELYSMMDLLFEEGDEE